MSWWTGTFGAWESPGPVERQVLLAIHDHRCRKNITNCPRYLCFKVKPSKEELYPLLGMYLLQLVHMDFLTVKNPGGKDINVFIITDHFTWYARAVMTSSQTAHLTAQPFWSHFIVDYKFTQKLLMDWGHNFEGQIIQELCHLTEVCKIWTTPYHPKTNGQSEHFNATLLSMIGILTKTSPIGETLFWLWSLPLTVQRIMPHILAHISSCLGGNYDIQ